MILFYCENQKLKYKFNKQQNYRQLFTSKCRKCLRCLYNICNAIRCHNNKIAHKLFVTLPKNTSFPGYHSSCCSSGGSVCTSICLWWLFRQHSNLISSPALENTCLVHAIKLPHQLHHEIFAYQGLSLLAAVHVTVTRYHFLFCSHDSNNFPLFLSNRIEVGHFSTNRKGPVISF